MYVKPIINQNMNGCSWLVTRCGQMYTSCPCDCVPPTVISLTRRKTAHHMGMLFFIYNSLWIKLPYQESIMTLSGILLMSEEEQIRCMCGSMVTSLCQVSKNAVLFHALTICHCKPVVFAQAFSLLCYFCNDLTGFV